MGQLYAYRDKAPVVAPTARVFDSAEITGDVVVGDDSIIGAGVRIIGDSHGPVRIGARVQILENSVLHLLPDNELIVEDDVIIGPACMIHGCYIGARTVVEPAATVCDWSRVGADSVVGAGAVVKQRATFDDHSEIDGFPATQVGTVDGSPTTPLWAFQPGDLDTIHPKAVG
jgi:carbonic anhydrase/acetyltransferase-like protein (isoleucine patch superfamily)